MQAFVYFLFFFNSLIFKMKFNIILYLRKDVLIANIKLNHRFSLIVDFIMNEYKVVYWEDTSGEFSFGTSVKSKFQQEITELAHEGWQVKSSNIAALPHTNNERRRVVAYALLEREIIPTAFRERSKTESYE
jgi:hypothetical protein